jgi:hypothetical protein
VPGFKAGVAGVQAGPQHSAAVVPDATSVPNDWTRGPCVGGVPVVTVLLTIGQVAVD